MRADDIAVSNTAMGLVLFVSGAITAGAASFGAEVALLLLTVLGVHCVAVNASLPEASAGR